MKKKQDLTTLSTADLATLLAENQDKVHKLGLTEGITRQKNVKEGRPANAAIARIKTELRRRAQAKAQ